MNHFLAQQKKLNKIADEKAREFFQELISKSEEKTVFDLRKYTLEFIKKNNIPEDISHRLKIKIDCFISNLKIPVQKDWTGMIIILHQKIELD